MTFKLSLPPEYAGSHISVEYATRVAGGVWSNFGHATTRIANANGESFFHIRMSSPIWISVRGTFIGTRDLGYAFTLACQAHWT